MTRLAWTLAAACALLAVGTAVAHPLPGAVDGGDLRQWWLVNAVAALSIGVVGGLVSARLPRNPIGWLLLSMALGHGLCGFGREYGMRAVAPGSGLPGGALAIWQASWTYVDAFAGLPIVFLFPDGRLRSRRWRPVAILAGLVALVNFAGAAFLPGNLLDTSTFVANPLGSDAVARVLEPIGFYPTFTAFLFMSLLGLASMVLRAHDAVGPARRGIVLVALATTLTLAETVFENLVDYPGVVYQSTVVTLLFVAAVALSILRYGLYEIDVVVNRTLVYGGLALVLGGLYVALTVLAGTAGGVVAAVLVALAFAPLRDRLQRAVDRWLFGERDDPYAVMTSLGEGLDAADVLPALADTVARTLKLPYVAIALGDETAAQRGELRGEPLILPLAYGGTTIGTLALGPRTPADAFTVAERRLFADIARQVGVAAHAVALTEDLQRSRESLITAREEERRRLRRDLHDGLGPTLAGVALQLETARRLPAAAADATVERVVAEVQAAIGEVRRLVYGLRPPALDELGLVPALRQQAESFSGLSISIDADPSLDRLPAAVEVAAYRIATEALTNVSRHAGARRAHVRLALNGSLEVEVADDGTGLPEAWSPGVGVLSIRERAAELGGTCAVGPAPGGGTRVLAKLPCAS